MTGHWTFVLSDTHLGEEQGLLTPFPGDDGTAAALTGALAAALATLAPPGAGRPNLVLNGDGLGLAFSPFARAADDFGAFVARLAAPDGPGVGAVLLVTGNHDHHLWEQARDERYRALVAAAPGPPLPPEPPGVTPLDPAAALPHGILQSVAARATGSEDLPVRVANPNVALRSADGERALLLHHGHHHEPVYHFVSRLVSWIFPERGVPLTVADIEAENHAWIDFVWSTLGQSGSAAADVERSYEKLCDPAAAVAELTDLVEDALGIRTAGGLTARIERAIVSAALRRTVGRRVCALTAAGPPPGTAESEEIARWLMGPVAAQLRGEWGARGPRDILYTFGHTHRPFEVGTTPGSDRLPQSVPVWNSGGWVVETAAPDATHGASLLVSDDEGSVAAVRLFDEAADGGVAEPRVAAVWTRDDEGGRRFAERVRDSVSPARGAWRAVREAASAAVRVRRGRLLAQVAS